ncbi:NAD(P)-dependent alcohol dehydrogenase [Ascoidea rubescens DSM 1968]|uniref:Xylitol dehydrogenase n=1 Tax=Ascoidea rubescens DSM 1968 TaxID=1344418 RepID=A0A1D2VH78_9ASCO|nr:xylitol dehydrogenase [Ascoidea rubescens DSM 1968]ODV60837.1 xylitol dehydrogenase [Ascoidea rubescens DSM 1968]
MLSYKNPSVVLQKPGKIVFEDRPVPIISNPYYVKVQIKKTGICGSDIHYYTHGSIGSFVVEKSMVLGHESSGIIVEKGSLVPDHLHVGDKVALEPGIPSRFSEEMKSGHYNLCPSMAFAATPPFDGTLCRYYLVPYDFANKLPDSVSLEEGALIEPLAVAVHANRLGNVVFGSKVAVFGAGPVGLLTAAVAKAFGATQVVVTDLFESKLKLAREMGATYTHSSVEDNDQSEEDIINFFIKNYFEPEIVIDCSGAETCIRLGISILKRNATYVQVGMGKDNINFPISRILEKEATFKGCFRYAHGDYKSAIELVANQKVNVKLLVTHRFSFEDSIKAYDFMKDGGNAVKCIIDGPTDRSYKL